MIQQSNTTDTSKVEFITNDFKLCLVGYPIWEATTAATETDCWIKVIPKIDISKRVIYLPNPRKFSTAKDKYILTRNDLKKIYQSHYNELIDGFFNSIPEDISNLVSRFKDSHWECVKAIILIGEDLIKLIKTNPVLAYVVFNLDKINKSYICYTSLEILQRMIRTKHKDILKLAGFPEAERMVRIFAKMNSHSITVKEIIKLKNILAINNETTEETLKILSFAKRIDEKLIVLIAENYMLNSRMTHKLFYDVLNSELFNEYLKSLSEIRYFIRRLNSEIPTLTSLRSVSRLKNRLKEEWTEKKKAKLLFSDPPIADNCFVQAICSEEDLHYWGRRQHNCIADYTKDIYDGKKYFYKVNYNNEEATLELKLNGEKVRKGSLLGLCNNKVTSGLRMAVDEWLKENRKN